MKSFNGFELLEGGLFKDIVEGLSDALVLLSGSRLVCLNDSARSIFGSNGEDVMSSSILEFFDIMTLDGGRIDAGKLADYPNSSRRALTAIDKRSSKRYVVDVFSVGSDGDKGESLCLVLKDITSDAEWERRLAASFPPRGVARVVGDLVHDLKNIVLGISGYAAIGMEEVQKDSRLYGDLEAIFNGTSDMASFIESLSSKAKSVSSRKRKENALTVVDGAVGRFLRIMPQGIELRVVDRCTMPMVMMDTAEIEQALLLVLINSKEAIYERGEITVTVESCSEEPEPGEIHNENYIKISIRDSGIGMDEETRREAIKPFFTTRRDGVHLGLGLAIVDSIVRAHDGRMELESSSGKGTEVRIFLPRA